LLEGSRVYPSEGGAFSVELDELAQTESQADDLMAPWIGLAQDLRVVDAGVAEERSGAALLWRRTRIDRAGRHLMEFQRHPLAFEVELGKFPTFDQETLELVVQARSRGELEFSIRGRSFQFEIPSTAENAARCEQSLREDAEAVPMQGFNLGAPKCAFEHGRFVARWDPDDNGWHVRQWDLSLGPEPASPSPAVVRSLREARLPIEPAAQLRERLSELGLTLP